MCKIEKKEMMKLTVSAEKYGKVHTAYIVPVDGLYGVWLTREDSDKVFYLYCLDIASDEEVVRDVMENLPMYIVFCTPEFDDPGPVWPED